MAIPTTPMMVPQNQTPYIPTGYETIQGDIARRRALADSLLNQQQQGPMTSPFQALAQVLAAWGGKHLEKRADQEQTDLDARRMADYQGRLSNFQKDISDPTADQTSVLAKYSTDPLLANNPLVEAMIKAQQKKMENSGEVTGAPIDLKGPDGNIHTFMQMKDGSMKEVSQGTTAHKMELGPSGQVYDPYNQKPGTVLNDVSKNVIIGPDGKPTLNTPAVSAALSIASAGKPSYNATFVNTGEGAYAKSIGDEIGKTDAAAIQAGRAAPQAYQSAQRIIDLLKKNPITGTGASARLALDSALATIGITGAGKVTATQNLQAEMANTTLANIHASGLGSGQGFTDKDREFLQKAKSGILESTPGNIKHLAELNQRAAVEAQKAGRRVFERMRANPATANMVSGLENDFNVPIGGTNSGVTIKRIK